MDQATQDEILSNLNEAEESLNSDDIETMNAARSRVDSAAMKIGQAVYNQQQSTPEGEQQQEEQQQDESNNQEQEQEKNEEGEKKN